MNVDAAAINAAHEKVVKAMLMVIMSPAHSDDYMNGIAYTKKYQEEWEALMKAEDPNFVSTITLGK